MLAIQRNKLFIASCLALLVTSLSLGMRAGWSDTWKYQSGLTQEQGIITTIVFWGFPVAIIIGGIVVDITGMKKLLVAAPVFQTILIFSATGSWSHNFISKTQKLK